MTGFAKTRHNSEFLFFYIFIIYVRIQMYVLAKFQLHILKTDEVTALQSSSNRKIDLYNKHWENKLQAFSKTDVTYE